MMNPLKKLAWAMKEYTYEAGVDLPWWHDNLAHFAGGALIGALTHFVLGYGYVGVGAVFIGLAGGWEAYEYTHGIRPWDEADGWTFDRAIEDTLLDTYVGLTGALLSVLVM